MPSGSRSRRLEAERAAANALLEVGPWRHACSGGVGAAAGTGAAGGRAGSSGGEDARCEVAGAGRNEVAERSAQFEWQAAALASEATGEGARKGDARRRHTRHRSPAPTAQCTATTAHCSRVSLAEATASAAPLRQPRLRLRLRRLSRARAVWSACGAAGAARLPAGLRWGGSVAGASGRAAREPVAPFGGLIATVTAVCSQLSDNEQKNKVGL